MRGIVLLGDVQGSKRAADRPRLGRKLRSTLVRLNRTHTRSLIAPFEVEKGVDEFAALLRRRADMGRVLEDLWIGLHPAPVRLALVQGPIDVVPRERSVRLFDGPAFHDAARLLVRNRRIGRLVTWHFGAEPGREAAARSLANVVYSSMLEWTPRQLEVFRAYRAHPSQTAVAKELGITQPTVSAALASIRGPLMVEVVEDLRRELSVLIQGGT